MSVSDKWSEPRGPDVRPRLEAPVKSRGLFIGERFGKQLALLKEAAPVSLEWVCRPVGKPYRLTGLHESGQVVTTKLHSL